MTPPLRLDAILARVLADRCPGVQACPSNSPLEPGGMPVPAADSRRLELWQVLPDAPRTWAEMGSPMDDLRHRRDLCVAAGRSLGWAVTLDRGDGDEVWAVPAQRVLVESTGPPELGDATPSCSGMAPFYSRHVYIFTSQNEVARP